MGKNYHGPLKYAKGWRHCEICPRQKEPFSTNEAPGYEGCIVRVEAVSLRFVA